MSNEMKTEEKLMKELENDFETEDYSEESSGSGKVIALGVAAAGLLTALCVAGGKKLKAKVSKDDEPKKKRKKRRLRLVEVEDEGEEIIDSEAVEVEATEK